MPLIRRVPGHRSSEQFRLAARRRFDEATRSVAAGDLLLGVYLAGYVAEMNLKAAYFRLSGKGTSDPISRKPDLVAAKKRAAGMNIDLGNFHDLSAWASLMIDARKVGGSAYEPGFARILASQVARVQANWGGTLRCRVNRPRPEEVGATFHAVAWLMANYHRL